MTTSIDRLRDAEALLIAARVAPWPRGPHSRELQVRVDAARLALQSLRVPEFAADFDRAREVCQTLVRRRADRLRLEVRR